jgi:hypothetical protein
VEINTKLGKNPRVTDIGIDENDIIYGATAFCSCIKSITSSAYLLSVKYSQESFYSKAVETKWAQLLQLPYYFPFEKERRQL